MKTQVPSVVCFGEVVWDVLPHGRFPGGAPFNVAYHLHRQGVRVALASAVGNDPEGEELLARLRAWGIDTSTVHVSATAPTGRVTAQLGASRDAHYFIHPDVAWDRIELTPPLLSSATEARALIFGSLAQRASYNRTSLDELLNVLPADAWRVFDVNLRAPHDDLALVGTLAAKATLLKLNSAEAARLAAGAPETPGAEEEHARTLQAETGCKWVCITAGERGAGLLTGGQWVWENGRRVDVVDTVGSGDSFLATLLGRLLRNPSDYCGALVAAARMGEWVATQRGATPEYAGVPVRMEF